MREIDTDKISKEMNDTLVHRACVMRSGQYLSRYLIHRNRSVDAIRLIGRCSVHDMSKIQNTEEFMLLASIVDQIDDMQDIKYVLSPEQIDTIHSIMQDYSFVLVYTNKREEKQVFFNYHNGTNGREGDVVTSLLDTHKKLSSIKNNPLVEWTTLLEYSPDHCDDAYSWFITFIFK